MGFTPSFIVELSAAKRSLFVWMSMQKLAYFSLDLWAQLTGSKDFYGLKL